MAECVTHHLACDCREARFKRLRDENVQLRREAGGLTEDGRTVPDLEAEVERLRDGIREIVGALDDVAMISPRQGGKATLVAVSGRAKALLDDRTETAVDAG